MTPKTELQKRVYKLSKGLPKLSITIKKWFAKNGFEHYVYKTKKENVCFTCGKSFTGIHKKCPYCKSILKVHVQEHKHKHRDHSYFRVITTYKRFQVIRCFFVVRYVKIYEPEDIIFYEVYQHWILPGIKDTIMASGVNGMSAWTYNEGWSLGSPLTIKDPSNRHYQNDGIVYPKMDLLPEVKRNGYTGDTHGLNLDYFLASILCNTAFETLLKTGRYDLISKFYHYDAELKLFWKQYIMAQRHGYKIKDLKDWLDHLKLLKYFKKDLHSPKYLFPKNFQKEHQELIERKMRIEEARRREQLRKVEEERIRKDKEAKENYIKMKKRFFDLTLSKGVLSITPLKSIDEFIEEGRALHHCVYSSTYYSNKDTLILSARKENERLETIEFSLVDYKVLQSRGACNKNTRYHKQIINLIESNANTIKKLARSKQSKVA